MDNRVMWVKNSIPKTEESKYLSLMSTSEIEKVRNFHSSFPQYQPTPLANLAGLSEKLGVAGIYVKDESKRFGLNAFKVLGGSFAMAKFISEETGRDLSQLGYFELTSDDVKKQLGEFTFFTATDGNHGRGVAWSATQIRQKSVVYMPKGSSMTRFKNIEKEGATVYMTDSNYDDAVRTAYEDSKKVKGGVVIQDTAWDGYEDIPGWIMQGYGTVAMEMIEQLMAQGEGRPTHIILQAGVGAFAGAMAGFFANYYGDECPVIITAEPHIANCLYQSGLKGDGTTVDVTGDLQTIMAGLACGEASSISWDILKQKTSFFASLPEYTAANGMRVLASPCKGDPAVVSGESGAAGFGLLYELLTNPECAELKKAAGIDENSRIAMVSTEGDTDPEQYRRIVWDGEYSAPKQEK